MQKESMVSVALGVAIFIHSFKNL